MISGVLCDSRPRSSAEQRQRNAAAVASMDRVALQDCESTSPNAQLHAAFSLMNPVRGASCSFTMPRAFALCGGSSVRMNMPDANQARIVAHI